ncbi:hypothetical protein E6O75_ATG05631 [Venturia nashicola]|uniref:Uncharacterized protein n=1 Tax=Venturia nashicola TaxID=86259 RepID=A0A4Z1P835_9PEZI|nr:hypothetical protein E6O75_ATG05631 [Venturia nashicola]
MPNLAILAVNKQVHHEARTVLLRENIIHFRNNGIPTGQSLELFKQANRFDILVLNHLQYLDEVVAFLEAHPNLHRVEIEIDLDPGVYAYDPHVELDKSGENHAEHYRCYRFTETIEPLRHLPTREGIHIELEHRVWSSDKWFRLVWGDTMQFVEQLNFDMRTY